MIWDNRNKMKLSDTKSSLCIKYLMLHTNTGPGCLCGCVFERSEANINPVQSTLLLQNYDEQRVHVFQCDAIWTSNCIQEHMCL